MMKAKLLVIGVGLFLLSSFCNADITGVSYQDDGDGAFVCAPYSWSGSAPAVSLNVVGNQYGEVGHIIGDITTDTPADPTLVIGNSIDNDLDFAWTAYNVNIYMSSPFSIINEYVSTPNDWTVSVIQPTYGPHSTQHIGSEGYDYMGQIQYLSGTPIAVGGLLDFGYSIVFDGYTNFTFCQEMVAIPEPASIGLIVLISGGLYFQRRFFVI